MKVNIIGSGIAGSSLAFMLKNSFDVSVFEKNNYTGGLVHCKNVEGRVFHITGGHCFNTKIQEVSDFFWRNFDKHDFEIINRKADILSEHYYTNYPIENNLKYLEADLQKQIVKELLSLDHQEKHQNLKEFFINRFGYTLFKLYFEKYNEKIWKSPIEDIPMDWLEGKLPMPSVQDIIISNINGDSDNMVHKQFFYPKFEGSQFYINKFLKGIPVETNYPGHFQIDDSEAYVYTGNLKHLPIAFPELNFPSNYIEQLDNLKSHGTTTVFVEFDNIDDFTWRYLPDLNRRHHRIINTGIFTEFNGKNTATIEFSGELSMDDIRLDINRHVSCEILDYNYAQYSYPIQDSNTPLLVSEIKEFLSTHNIYLLGRFATWEYMNMDIVIRNALHLSEELSSRFLGKAI